VVIINVSFITQNEVITMEWQQIIVVKSITTLATGVIGTAHLYVTEKIRLWMVALKR
jgi:hypothetical protein